MYGKIDKSVHCTIFAIESGLVIAKSMNDNDCGPKSKDDSNVEICSVIGRRETCTETDFGCSSNMLAKWKRSTGKDGEGSLEPGCVRRRRYSFFVVVVVRNCIWCGNNFVQGSEREICTEINRIQPFFFLLLHRRRCARFGLRFSYPAYAASSL